MRTVLRLLGTRNGIALVLCMLVLGVVGVFRGVAGSRGAEPVAPVIAASSTPSIDPSIGDDGEADPVDTVAPPSLSPNAAEPAAVATRFANAWLKTGVSSEAWIGGLAPHSTRRLLDTFKGVDPNGGPTGRITGDPRVAVRESALAEATIPMDSGTLRLRLLVERGQWRVDGVDWVRPT